MKRRYKLKKKPLIVLILILLVIIFLISLLISHLKNKSYSLEYNIDDYKINENYDSNKELYYYEIKYNNVEYNFVHKSKYLKEKKLIKNVSSNEENALTCLYIESDYLSTNPLCSKEGKVVYYKTNEETTKDEKEINNYTFYNNVSNVYLWTYKGVSYMKGNDLKEITIFSKDIYDVPLSTVINNYLVIPDYEQNYAFNKVYLINLDNNKKDTWKLKYDISFDSVVLGINKESIFILDNKNKIEYELVPHKQKMRIVGTDNKQGVIYEYGELKRKSLKEIQNSNLRFKYSNIYHYETTDEGLYLKYLDSNIKTLITDKKITSVISIREDEIYYLVDDILYRFNIKDGETKLIKYADWEFNHDNMIFIKPKN